MSHVLSCYYIMARYLATYIYVERRNPTVIKVECFYSQNLFFMNIISITMLLLPVITHSIFIGSGSGGSCICVIVAAAASAALVVIFIVVAATAAAAANITHPLIFAL